MLKNIYVQCVLLFILIVGGYTAYVNLTYTEDTSETMSDTTQQEAPNTSSNTADGTGNVPDTDDALDLTGTHIMGDGSVMTGKGVIISDATILPDGMIELNDGTIIEPMFDLRKPEAEAPPSAEMPEEAVFDLTGWNFAYDVTEIKVAEGTIVTINFESTEGFHDWVVDEFDAATERVDEGEKTSVTFVADKAGTYEYYCSVSGHREKGHVGTLIVE